MAAESLSDVAFTTGRLGDAAAGRGKGALRDLTWRRGWRPVPAIRSRSIPGGGGLSGRGALRRRSPAGTSPRRGAGALRIRGFAVLVAGDARLSSGPGRRR